MKIAVVTGWFNFGGQGGISDDIRFMTDCFFNSAKKHFLPHHDVDFIFMNNSDIKIEKVKNINFNYEIDGFWHMCLMKILSLRFLDNEYDYIFVHDNDQVFIKDVNDNILDSDFVFLDHFYYHNVDAIHKEVTDIVELNFDTLKETWTMGNFFGGKKKNMMELLENTEKFHNKYFGHHYKDQHFYSKYPEEIFILKYVFENNINYKRLNNCTNPLEAYSEVFLSDWGDHDNIPEEVKNVTLLHNVKKDLTRLKKFYKKD